MARVLGLILLVLISISLLAPLTLATPPEGPLRGFNGVLGRWILLLDPSPVLDGGVLSIENVYDAQEPVVRLVESLGGRVIHRHWVINAISFEASVDVVTRLKSMGYVIVADRLYEPQVLRVPGGVEVLAPDPIGVRTIGADRLHALGITGSGVRVAVVDTGVENLHPWLIRGGRSVVGWEVDATNSGIIDYCGKRIGYHEGGVHGTHIAGIIASQSPRALGVAPGAIIYDIIVFSEWVNCWWAWGSDIIRGIELALVGPDGQPNTGDEADVINLSLGSVIPPWWLAHLMGITDVRVVDTLHEAIRRAVSLGKFVVVAAANEAGHMTINELCAPTGVICVGSSHQMGTPDKRDDDRISWFSSRGPLPWAEIAPTVVAPGENIYSTVPTALAIEWRLPEPAMELSGTSMAAPHVSGALALLIDHYRRQGKVLTVDMATRLLVHSSTTVWTTWALDLAGPLEVGAGLINVYDAAFTDIMVDVNGSYKITVLALRDKVNLTLTIDNLRTTPVNVEIRVWIDDILRKRLPIKGYEHAVSITPRVVNVPAGGRANVLISIDTTKLPPGVYGAYIDVIADGRSYRAMASILLPAKPQIEGFKVRAVVPDIIIGRHTRLYWTFIEWTMVAFYIDKPLVEYATIRVEVKSPFASPVTVKVMDARTARLLSYGYSGYILTEPGLYLVFLEITDTIYWWLGFTGNTDGDVILEAPLFETTAWALKANISDLASRVTSLESRVSITESRLSNLEGRVSNLESRVRDVEATLSSVLVELSKLKDEVRVLNESFRNLNSRVTSLESTVLSLVFNVSRLELSLADVKRRVSDIESSLDVVKRDVDRLRGELEGVRVELRTSIDKLAGELRGLQVELGKLRLDLENTRVELSKAINATEARLSAEIREQARRVDELVARTDTIARELRSLEVSLTNVNKTLTSRLEEASKRIGEQGALIAKLEGEKEKLKSDLMKLVGDIEETRRALEERIEDTSRRLEEVGFRNTVIGATALAIGIAAVAAIAYMITRRKSS